MLRHVPSLILMLCFGVLSYQLFGPDGAWFHAEDLRRNLAEQLRQNELQRQKNEELRAELASLENGSEAIEERARRELYMVKQGEVLFRLETPADYERRLSERASMPDYRNADGKTSGHATFTAKRGDLYYAPRNQRAPAARH